MKKNPAQLISKKEKNTTLKKIKKINAFYNTFFSETRLKVLGFFGCVVNVLVFLLPAALFTAFGLFCGYLLNQCFSEIDSNTLMTAAYSLFGVSAGLIAAVYIGIRISLGNTNEYFNRTESKMFFGIYWLKYSDNGLLAINSIYYCAAGLLVALFQEYSGSFVQCLLSIFISAFLLIRYNIYSKKNRHERFEYYLIHSRNYNNLSKKDIILDYRMMFDVVDGKGKLKKKKMIELIDKRAYSVFQYISELGLTIERDENIVFEQNILESFYVGFSKRTETPIQLFSLNHLMQEYLNCVLEANTLQRKDISKTRDNFYLVLRNALQSKTSLFAKTHLNIDDFPVYSLSIKGMYALATEKIGRLLTLQAAIVTIYEGMVEVVENKEAFNGLSAIDLSEEKRIVKDMRSNVLENLGSLKKYVEREKGAFEKMYNDIKSIEMEKKK